MGRGARRKERSRQPEEAPSRPPKEQVEEAYRETTRTASRASLLGALGFGVALIMFTRMVTGQAAFGGEPLLERFLALGGVTGGLIFTFVAWRASRAARSLRRLLEEDPPKEG